MSKASQNRRTDKVVEALQSNFDDLIARLNNLESNEGAAVFSPSYALLEDQKAQNTAGGAFNSGADRTRDLNTEVYDPDGIVSLSSNQFTLGAGTYLIEWSAPARAVAHHQTILYDVTGAADVQRGSTERAGINAGAVATETPSRSFGAAVVTPGGNNAYEIRHRCETTKATNGFGSPANLGTESYTRVKITKLA